jgi:hypothetical protein
MRRMGYFDRTNPGGAPFDYTSELPTRLLDNLDLWSAGNLGNESIGCVPPAQARDRANGSQDQRRWMCCAMP